MPFDAFGDYKNEERPAPVFDLPSGAGERVRLWDYKQRKPLVIYFVAGDESAFLQRLNSENQLYRDFGAQLLVISGLEGERLAQLTYELNLSYPLLADADNRVHSRYIQLVYPQYDAAQIQQKPAALFIADRFGSIYRYATAISPDKLPPQPEIIEVLEFMGNLCNP